MISTLLGATMLCTSAFVALDDTLQAQDLHEVQVISSTKEMGSMRSQTASVSLIGGQQLEQTQTHSLKGISLLAPNFFMPDYGSRLSSAVYIRGIGSRMNSPAVGLYVDDVPVLDKSAFDEGFYDIERVDILRGPQSTLYGNGTMGGVIKVHTRNPFDYQGTDIRLGYGAMDLQRRLSVTHYHRPSERFAFSVGGYYDGGEGFFRNDLTDKKVDAYNMGGARFRGILHTRHDWTLDMTASMELSSEGAYPYYYIGKATGEEDHPELLHKISPNRRGSYDRRMFGFSVNAQKTFPWAQLNSITAFQAVDDSMAMDQDFITADVYQMNQMQQNVTLSEELTLKSVKPGRWQWVGGLLASLFDNGGQAPVTFHQDGIDMLNANINGNANRFMPAVAAGPMTMNFRFSDNIQGNSLLFDNDFDVENLSLGLFHQSTIHRLFGLKGLCATLGLRFNVERQNFSYQAGYAFSHAYALSGVLTPMNKEVSMVPETIYNVKNDICSDDHLGGSAVHKSYVEWMPRVALKYDLPWGNVYAIVSRGFRSGGYNMQNISELLRSMMQTDMMQDVRDATVPVLSSQPMVPQDKKDQIIGMLNQMATPAELDVEAACRYAPEYAWNYEVGSHWNLLDGRLNVDASAFLSDIQDLQLSQMSETGMGRIMVNAGKSRSAGLELMLKAQVTHQLAVQANYGYTHAIFLNYRDYDSSTQQLIDCRHRYVPFMPQHSMNVDAAYTFRLKGYGRDYKRFRPTALTLGANCSGAGRIYWTEQNDAYQNFYALLGARLSLHLAPLTITAWAHNLTATHYNTFQFVSASRTYEQHGKPLQAGIDLRLRF